MAGTSIMDRTDPPANPPPDPPGAHAPGSPGTPGSPKPTAPHPTRHSTSTRLLVTLGVIFLSVFLFLRTFAVEPFGVPTGSMAPTLIGNHREGFCPRCEHPIRVGI